MEPGGIGRRGRGPDMGQVPFNGTAAAVSKSMNIGAPSTTSTFRSWGEPCSACDSHSQDRSSARNLWSPASKTDRSASCTPASAGRRSCG